MKTVVVLITLIVILVLILDTVSDRKVDRFRAVLFSMLVILLPAIALHSSGAISIPGW